MKKYGSGCDYVDSFPETITIHDSVEDAVQNSKKSLQERALAKLTPAERIALGFQ